MDARSVHMVMDNWFLREAGATNAAPWHHDEPYFDFEGKLCVLWMPLEAVEHEESLAFARGSHRWDRLFAAQQFSENVPFDTGTRYEPVPDLDATLHPHDRLQCALEPGDCLVFDFRTLHGAAAGKRPLERTSHRFTLRFAAQGARFFPRGDWTREISDFLIARGQRPGEVLDCELLPVVWTEATTS
jgi:ectoine hydroxylase-related dioxygenase (phytanoyl-CoA dioxygenase family)